MNMMIKYIFLIFQKVINQPITSKEKKQADPYKNHFSSNLNCKKLM